jgi:hypothetical protein
MSKIVGAAIVGGALIATLTLAACAGTLTGSGAAAIPTPAAPAPVLSFERQAERAIKVRIAKQKKAAKAKWAHEAKVKAEKVRQERLAREAEEARQNSIGNRDYAVPDGVPQDWVPCGDGWCPRDPATDNCPDGTNYVPYAGRCVDGDW